MKNAALVVLVLLGSSVLTIAQEPKSDKSPAKQFDSGLASLTGGASEKVSEGLQQVRSSADSGYAPAQTAMGSIYYEGQFVTRDTQQAIAWYKKAAAQGDRIAEMALGYMYYTGAGISRDLETAKRFFNDAANAGDPLSAYYMGLIAEQKDYAKAPEQFRKAAEQGLVQAQVKLAAALDAGRGAKRDAVKAFVWYLVAADSGAAQVNDEVTRLQADMGSAAAQSAREKSVSLRSDTVHARNSLGCFDWPGRELSEPTPPPLFVQPSCKR